MHNPLRALRACTCLHLLDSHYTDAVFDARCGLSTQHHMICGLTRLTELVCGCVPCGGGAERQQPCSCHATYAMHYSPCSHNSNYLTARRCIHYRFLGSRATMYAKPVLLRRRCTIIRCSTIAHGMRTRRVRSPRIRQDTVYPSCRSCQPTSQGEKLCGQQH